MARIIVSVLPDGPFADKDDIDPSRLQRAFIQMGWQDYATSNLNVLVSGHQERLGRIYRVGLTQVFTIPDETLAALIDEGQVPEQDIAEQLAEPPIQRTIVLVSAVYDKSENARRTYAGVVYVS